jgi:hypothetical protein
MFPMAAILGHAIMGWRALEIVAKMAAGFGDYLDTALHKPALASICCERRKRDSGHFGIDELDRFRDVGEARRRGPPSQSEHLQRCGPDAVFQKRMKTAARRDVRLAAKRTGCGFLDIYQLEQADGAFGMVEKEIDVGIFPALPACHGAEQVQVLDAKSS